MVRILQLLPTAAISLALLSACSGGSSSALDGSLAQSGKGLPSFTQAATKTASTTLYVLNTGGDEGNVTVYAQGESSPLRTVPLIAAVNANRNAFFMTVGNKSGLLYAQYPDKATGWSGPELLTIFRNQGAKQRAPIEIQSDVGIMTSDNAGNVYTVCGNKAVCEFNRLGQSVRTINLSKCAGVNLSTLATDPKGDLAIGCTRGVFVYTPESSAPSWEVSHKLAEPHGLAFDRSGRLYIATAVRGIFVYKEGRRAPIQTITTGVNNPTALAFDTSNNLYVLNYRSSIVEYAASQSSPERTISSGLTSPVLMAVDGSGNVYAANNGGSGDLGNVVVYAAGSSTPEQTITDGIDSPQSIGVSY